MKEFPEEPFSLCGAKDAKRRRNQTVLRCVKPSITDHCTRPKHKTDATMKAHMKEDAARIEESIKWMNKEVASLSLLLTLHTYHLQEPLVGFTIPADTQAFRIETVDAMMEAGIPPTAMDGTNGEKSRLRSLFELTSRRGLADCIPVLRESEIQAVKAKLRPNPLDDKHCIPVGIMFDGSGLSESAEAVALRFLDQTNPQEWALRQPLASLQVLKKSPTGRGLAGSINTVVQTRYGIPPSAVVAGTHDRAATNGVAMETLSPFYPVMEDPAHDQQCTSYFLSHR
jgi:hypothetical protein